MIHAQSKSESVNVDVIATFLMVVHRDTGMDMAVMLNRMVRADWHYSLY